MTDALKCPYCDEAVHPVIGAWDAMPVVDCPAAPAGKLYGRGKVWAVNAARVREARDWLAGDAG